MVVDIKVSHKLKYLRVWFGLNINQSEFKHIVAGILPFPRLDALPTGKLVHESHRSVSDGHASIQQQHLIPA